MLRVLIFGATGYTGVELIRLLSSHPEVVIAGGASQQWAGKKAGEVFPFIPTNRDFPLSTVDELMSGPDADLAFLALPHGAAAAAVRPLLDRGLKVVDLSADCRLRDAQVYADWYGPHPDPEILRRAVYGLPEIHREIIKKSDLVGNPGCYPTSVILGLAPLMRLEAINTDFLVIDSKSGISGAGRGAKATTSFCEAGEGFKPYAVTRHRHVPEMEQELSLVRGRPVTVRFTPHLIPASRGMVSTMYAPLKENIPAEEIRALYERSYSEEPFVTILAAGIFPDTAYVRGSNQCHISIEIDERTGMVIAMSALDNLVKGASGAAVQNMNLMAGLDETLGLTGLPFFP